MSIEEKFLEVSMGRGATKVFLYEIDGTQKQLLYQYEPSDVPEIAIAELVQALHEHPTCTWLRSSKAGGGYITSATLPGRSDAGQWDRIARIGAQLLYDPKGPERVAALAEAFASGLARVKGAAKTKGGV